MESIEQLVIETGEKRLAVNGDPAKVIVFNPTDILFVEKLYRLFDLSEEKSKEFDKRDKELAQNTGVDKRGIPTNSAERIALMKEACQYMREQIDDLFGSGTSQKAFGDAMTLDMFRQFFNGVLPHVQQKRVEKIAKYTSATSAKRNKRKK